jgi:ankyrin repeat protein
VGEPDRIEKLILKGADINARAANGQTPLHVAGDHGSYGAIRVLLDAKANPNIKDQQGRTPVQLAIGYDSAIEMLLAGGAEPSDILVASFAGRVDLVQGFLAKDKALVGARTLSGETALHFAARRGHVKVAEVLLSQGADVNAIDNERNKLTPLHWAASYAGPEMSVLLLANKADRNAKSWDGRTALGHARDSRNEKTIHVLEKQP